MAANIKRTNIIQSFTVLKGNTRTCIIFEPMWGIPFVLCNFYLSLYMKELGITDTQIGYLISIGAITGAVFSLFGGIVTDALGRKRTTLLFDLLSWPLSYLLYFFSSNFWMFAAATILNSSVRVVMVSYNLMLVEDADSEQRSAAFNLLNIINIASGVITPLAGVLVKYVGVIRAERIFLLFAIISMTLMMLFRNHYYKETKIGQQILAGHSKKSFREVFSRGIYRDVFRLLKSKPDALIIITVVILFNLYVPLGTYSSMYYAPFLNEVLGIDKAAISILGGVNSAVMFMIFVFVNPLIRRSNMVRSLLLGAAIQLIAIISIILIPEKSMSMALLCVVTFAAGFAMFRPFIDTILADVTEGNTRAGVYSLINTVTAALSTLMGVVSGYLYDTNPRILFTLSIGILVICIMILLVFQNKHWTKASKSVLE